MTYRRRFLRDGPGPSNIITFLVFLPILLVVASLAAIAFFIELLVVAVFVSISPLVDKIKDLRKK